MPASRRGTFASAFANLSFAKKARVFQTVEAPAGGERRVDSLPRRQPARPRRLSRLLGGGRLRREAPARPAPAGRLAADALRRRRRRAQGAQGLLARTEAGRIRVRDVIVVGAGGGGPVVAKELAARGLDVLLLEAGAAFAHSRARVVALRERGEQPGDGLLPLRARRPHAAAAGCATCRRTASSGRRPASAARPCTTSATRRARCPGVSRTTPAPTRTRTTAITRSRSATAS